MATPDVGRSSTPNWTCPDCGKVTWEAIHSCRWKGRSEPQLYVVLTYRQGDSLLLDSTYGPFDSASGADQFAGEHRFTKWTVLPLMATAGAPDQASANRWCYCNTFAGPHLLAYCRSDEGQARTADDASSQSRD